MTDKKKFRMGSRPHTIRACVRVKNQANTSARCNRYKLFSTSINWRSRP
jgi:hypothetical protein